MRRPRRDRGPRSITGQITLIVVASVVLGVLLFAGVVFAFSESVSRLKPPVTLARIATVAQMVGAAETGEEATRIADAAARVGVPVTLRDRAAPRASAAGSPERAPERAGVFAPLARGLLAERLETLWDRKVVEIARGPQERDGGALLGVEAGPWGVLVFDVSDVTSLWAYLAPPAFLTLAIVLIVVALLSIWGVRWIIAPLRALAAAAETFGRAPDEAAAIDRDGPREIVRLAEAMDEMRTRIRALIDDRTRMLTAISHDLNTPLTRLALRAERIADPALRRGILHETAQVTRMLDETLDHLRADQTSEPPARVDLPSLLQTLCAEFADAGHDVRYQGPARLAWRCRPGLMARALGNVVDNAVRHGSTVAVTLREAAGGGGVEIDVSDDGPGIRADRREALFAPFAKGDAARGPAGRNGFGLGLSIARDVVRGHGGEIRLLDRAPRGLIV
ncbi:MAG: HAMP domain-containing sensor histidine kinase, partial [Pseudomonadota bacterium]|nr:HAMP domain-containing sensor histidine kinase [Pseudomonadota bacterium]